jgi:hypothetical protein
MVKTLRVLAALCCLAGAPAWATVSETSSATSAIANGTTRVYAFNFPVFEAGWVKATVDGVAASYTVALNAVQASQPGGAVTFAIAPASNAIVRIERVVPLTQGLTLSPYSPFPAKSLERALDKVTLALQGVEARLAAAEEEGGLSLDLYDPDGDGWVERAEYAANADTLDGYHASDFLSQLGGGGDPWSPGGGTVGGGNLLRNSSFESDADANGAADGFLLYGAVSTITRESSGRYGSKLQRVTWAAPTATPQGITTSAALSVVGKPAGLQGQWRANQWYVISGYSRAFGDASGVLHTGFFWNRAPDQLEAIDDPALDGEWRRWAWKVRWTVSPVPDAGELFVVGKVAAGNVPAGSFDLDGLQAEEGQVATGWAPYAAELLPSEISADLIADFAILNRHLAEEFTVNGGMIADLSITSADLQDGSVSAAKLIDGAIGVGKFGSGLRPVQVVGSLPALPDALYPQGALAFLASDNKLYRSTGSAWTAAVPAGDLSGYVVGSQIDAETITGDHIIGNAITANKIDAGAIQVGHIATDAVTANAIAANAIGVDELAANAVVAGKIAAGAITVRNLTVANWDNLVPNPSTFLTTSSTPPIPAGEIEVAGFINNGSYGNCRAVPVGTGQALSIAVADFPASPGEQFYFSAKAARSTAANGGTVVLRMVFLDKDGGTLTTSDSTAAIWIDYPNIGAGTLELVEGSATAPPLTVKAKIEMRASGTTGAVTGYFNHFYARRMADAKLIVDGAIEARHVKAADISAGLLTADVIKTSTYNEEDGSQGSGKPVGTPLVGAKLDRNGVTLKVAVDGVQFGQTKFSDLWSWGFRRRAGTVSASGANAWIPLANFPGGSDGGSFYRGVVVAGGVSNGLKVTTAGNYQIKWRAQVGRNPAGTFLCRLYNRRTGLAVGDTADTYNQWTGTPAILSDDFMAVLSADDDIEFQVWGDNATTVNVRNFNMTITRLPD